MIEEQRQQLRDAALAAVRAVRSRLDASRAAWGADWTLQTSNSFRRIGTPHGDGDVLCGTKHPHDGHPDLLADPRVLDYMVAAQPRVVIQLLDDVAALEDKLAAAKVLCDRIADVEARLDGVAGTIEKLGKAFSQLATLDPHAVEEALLLVDQIVTTLQEVHR